jgi:hypothetical protein
MISLSEESPNIAVDRTVAGIWVSSIRVGLVVMSTCGVAMDLASPFCFRPPETWHVPYPRQVKK